MAGTRPTTPRSFSKNVVVVDVHDDPIEDEDAILIYRWLDSLEFSRCRKTSANRDFADGVMMAELVANYIPKIINAMYYVPTSSTAKKIGNWEHLNHQVFKRIGFQLTPEAVKDLAAARPGMIERVLKSLQPILFEGHRAVRPVSRKLENIKPRFMDFQKNNLRAKAERPQTAETKVTHSRSVSRPKTAVSSRATCLGKKGKIKPSSAAPMELEVIKNPISVPEAEQKCPPGPPSPSTSKTMELGEFTQDYEIFTRPSTVNSDRTSSDKLILEDKARESDPTLDKKLEERASTNESVSRRKPRIPVRTTWLPVEGEVAGVHSDLGSVLADKEDTVDVNCISSDGSSPNQTQEEMYTNFDQSGYEEDVEENDGTDDEKESVDDDPVFVPSSGDSRTKQPKRKLKRVVKYEYREEYLLNMATCQLPNSEQLESLKRDYMNPGNKDPNCRGYGFV